LVITINSLKYFESIEFFKGNKVVLNYLKKDLFILVVINLLFGGPSFIIYGLILFGTLGLFSQPPLFIQVLTIIGACTYVLIHCLLNRWILKKIISEYVGLCAMVISLVSYFLFGGLFIYAISLFPIF
jgi:hypothetical protein